MLNSILSILYAILILFTSMFSGISVKDNSVDFTGHVFSVDITSEGFKKHFQISENELSYHGTENGPIAITSKDELNTLLLDCKEKDWDESIFQFAESICEDYFDENILIALVALNGHSGVKYKIIEITSEETRTTLEYKYYAGGDGASFASVATYHILIAEVKKSDIMNTENLVTKATQVYSRDDL